MANNIDEELRELADELDNDDEENLFILILWTAIAEHLEKPAPIPCRTSILSGQEYMLEVLNNPNESPCYEAFRMKPTLFLEFCATLQTTCGLRASRHVSVQEMVAMFLFILAHNVSVRMVQGRFQRSGWTVSKYFRRTLKAVYRLGVTLISPPDFNVVPPKIRSINKFYPFFKDCISAIDGTHVDACIPRNEQAVYFGRYNTPTWNVMAVVDFDMCFTFVLPGWEGTAHDSRVFTECIDNPTNGFPLPPEGKYYLVDSGYPNTVGFLAPYRGERYHNNDFRGRLPSGAEELFNRRHSSLRNVVERTFGCLKGRFPILTSMPPYPVKIQKYIPTACCTIHNFIMKRGGGDTFSRREDVTGDDGNEVPSSSATHPRFTVPRSNEQVEEMGRVRDEIAQALLQRRRRR